MKHLTRYTKRKKKRKLPKSSRKVLLRAYSRNVTRKFLCYLSEKETIGNESDVRNKENVNWSFGKKWLTKFQRAVRS